MKDIIISKDELHDLGTLIQLEEEVLLANGDLENTKEPLQEQFYSFFSYFVQNYYKGDFSTHMVDGKASPELQKIIYTIIHWQIKAIYDHHHLSTVQENPLISGHGLTESSNNLIIPEIVQNELKEGFSFTDANQEKLTPGSLIINVLRKIRTIQMQYLQNTDQEDREITKIIEGSELETHELDTDIEDTSVNEDFLRIVAKVVPEFLNKIYGLSSNT